MRDEDEESELTFTKERIERLKANKKALKIDENGVIKADFSNEDYLFLLQDDDDDIETVTFDEIKKERRKKS